jgi:uncharacterized protein YdaU (DUF1376 family)
MPSTPYMKLYIGDYLADTQHFSCLEHGAYILLIMAYWQNGGPLENNPKLLRRLTRTDPKMFRKCSENVLKMFQVTDGFLVHKRIEKELSEREQVSIAARKSINSRWNGRNTDVSENGYERNTTPIVHRSIDPDKENSQDARVESTEPKKPEFAKAVFEAWAELQVSAYQPANYLNFLNSTWARIRPSFQGIHSDDVLAAIQNFKSIAAAAPGKYWWTRKTSIEKWASEHMEKFLPANFKESDFLIGKPQDTRGGALGDRPDAKTPEEQAAWSKELEDRLKNSEEVEINFAELAQGTELGRRLAQEKNAVL